MNTKTYLKISCICLIFGLLFCAYQQEWIIFRRPGFDQSLRASEPVATKKIITRTYWHQGKWHRESAQLVWPAHTARAAELVISSWLSLLDEEGIYAKKIAVQTVMIAPSGQELYVSFDHSPFDMQQTIHEKWMWVEGLLATLKENLPTITCVRFLARHKPLNDAHLDFTNAWPLRGFLS